MNDWGREFPALDRGTLVALRNDEEYPMNYGRIGATNGMDIAMDAFNSAVEEHQAPYSNALQAELSNGGRYLTGPLARLALNYEQLTPLCKRLATEAGIEGGTRNPYKSIIVRALLRQIPVVITAPTTAM